MWYQVKALREKKFNKSQISRELEMDRGTVRKYLSMTEDEFLSHIQNTNRMAKKLKLYYGYVESLLKAHPYLSAAQVEDRLKEKYDNLPKVHAKTVYNFVQSIRREKEIPKPKGDDTRPFEQVSPSPYGQEAQVDFGEQWMRHIDGQRLKVYFMAIVLSRSRYKHISFTDRPYTSQTAVKAHQLALEYIQGVPQKILYDQDKVFIKDEYGGDVVLTSIFKRYVDSESFDAVFCRKSDPQSKGKVENVVKYVKQNFLRGRSFYSLEQLNEEAIKWLERTANVKKHGATQQIPKSEWLKEKEYLSAITSSNIHYLPAVKRQSYKVRKDNTVVYKSNFYSVPTGTYINKYSSVWIEIQQGQLHIYNKSDGKRIATHTISILQGQLIRNTNHLRDKQSSLKEKEKQVLSMLNNDPQCTKYLHGIHADKPRYYHDHLREMIKILQVTPVSTVKTAMHKCLTLQIYNAYDLRKLIATMSTNSPEDDKNELQTKLSTPQQASIQPVKSNIDTYQLIMNKNN